MSLEDAENSPIHRRKDFTLLHGINDCSKDMLECLSMVMNDEEESETQMQSIILDDHSLLGTTLTAITLPNGTQAFVTNNLTDTDVYESKRTSKDVENPRRIVIREVSESPDSKAFHFQLESPNILDDEVAGSSKSDDAYSAVEIIDGTAYMLSETLDDEIWEIKNGKLQKKGGNVVIKKISDVKIQYPCPREGCTKAYSTLHHLHVHERSHTGLRPYKCSQGKCKKSFSTGYSLKAHLRTHTGEKPYKCTAESCPKSFKTSGDLLKHMRTHTGERPFLCPFIGCGRSFTTSNIRKVHMRTHTGERPYKCSQCSKAFASATNYKNHVRIHSGEKPYACSIENCKKRFTEYSSLYKHHLVHTQQKPFECDLCLKRYRQSNTLVMHKRTAHALEADDDLDAYLDCCKIDARTSAKSKLTVNEVNVTETTLDADDAQILLVSDSTSLTAYQLLLQQQQQQQQQMNLEENFDEVHPSLEELNIKIGDMELAWH